MMDIALEFMLGIMLGIMLEMLHRCYFCTAVTPYRCYYCCCCHYCYYCSLAGTELSRKELSETGSANRDRNHVTNRVAFSRKSLSHSGDPAGTQREDTARTQRE